MAEEIDAVEPLTSSKKRKFGQRRSGKSKKQKQVQPQFVKERVRIDPKLKKFLRKKARDYNSDDDNEEEEVKEMNHRIGDGNAVSYSDDDSEGKEEEEEEKEEFGSDNEGEDGEIQPGITKLSEGCRAFRVAFKSIMKKNNKSEVDNPLGPVLSVHKKLIAEKLEEEEAERKRKGKAKKEKQLVGEKGHVKPDNNLVSHEKFLISVATKGVVKLFNAVNKAQNAQKGLNPSRLKDEKVLQKRKKEAFFSELAKTPVNASAKGHTSSGPVDNEGPSWAPLQDSYMLTTQKLKNWDKMTVQEADDNGERMSDDSSSDEE